MFVDVREIMMNYDSIIIVIIIVIGFLWKYFYKDLEGKEFYIFLESKISKLKSLN